MKQLTAFYLSIPETPRKALRDFVATTVALVLATGVLDQATPNYHTLSHAVVAAAGLAGWRVARKYLPAVSSP